jgi:hypothetical protein
MTGPIQENSERPAPEREMSTNTLIKTEQQLREEIAALKREEEKLQKIDEELKHNIEVVHEKRAAHEHENDA